MFKNKAQVDVLRTLAFGSIGSSFVAVGAPFSYQARIICFTNTTPEDVIFSMDGTTDQLIVPASSFKLFDITMNRRPVNTDDFCFAIGTQWYVRYTSAPASGAVYIEVVYTQPG
jgi:hypothetical protein